MKTMLIGQVAKMAGVGVGAIRLYERRKLIPSPPRGRSGYRLYPEDTVLRVQVLAAAKCLGFTLREIGGARW
jgi:MerR family copper efflux transcriptional regulator